MRIVLVQRHQRNLKRKTKSYVSGLFQYCRLKGTGHLCYVCLSTNKSVPLWTCCVSLWFNHNTAPTSLPPPTTSLTSSTSWPAAACPSSTAAARSPWSSWSPTTRAGSRYWRSRWSRFSSVRWPGAVSTLTCSGSTGPVTAHCHSVTALLAWLWSLNLP